MMSHFISIIKYQLITVSDKVVLKKLAEFSGQLFTKNVNTTDLWCKKRNL